MSFVIKPIPDPAHVLELKLLLDHKDDEKFVTMLLESLKKANDQARNDGLDPAIYDALLAKALALLMGWTPLAGWAPLTGQALAETSDRCIEDQAVIDKILAHLIKKGALPPPPKLLPAARASPGSDWFAWSRDFTSTVATRLGNKRTGCLVA